MLLLPNVLLYLKDVFLLQFGQITNAELEAVVHMVATLEVEIVCLLYHVKKAKYGIMIWLIVFVLKELNGMVINAYHVVVEKFGSHLSDVYAQRDTSLLEQDVKSLILLDAYLYQMLYGMANNVFAMMDLML